VLPHRASLAARAKLTLQIAVAFWCANDLTWPLLTRCAGFTLPVTFGSRPDRALTSRRRDVRGSAPAMRVIGSSAVPRDSRPSRLNPVVSPSGLIVQTRDCTMYISLEPRLARPDPQLAQLARQLADSFR